MDYIETLGDIVTQQPSLRFDAIQAMRSQSRLLVKLQSDADRVARYMPWRKEDWESPMRHRFFCNWIGADANDPARITANLASVDRLIHENAYRLILASQPFWKDEIHSVPVIDDLRELGRPAVNLMPEAFQHGHPRARAALLDVLERLHPSVKEVSAFVESEDSELVLTGYRAARDKVYSPDAPTAIARLGKLRASGALDERQMATVLSLLQEIQERMNIGKPRSLPRSQ
jgi:hypothetical protein